MISHQRRGTVSTIRSLKSLKSVFSRQEKTEEPMEHSTLLASISLPPSLASLDNFSPGLWQWVNAGEYLQETFVGEPPVLFNPAGDRVQVLPPHLQDVQPDSSWVQERMGLLPVNQDLKRSLTTMKRKPVMQDNKIKLSDIHLQKPCPGNQIVCVITTGDQKKCTSVLPVQKQQTVPRGQSYCAYANQGFLFDVNDNRDEFVLTCRLYSCEEMVISPSIDSLASAAKMPKAFNILKLKRSNTISRHESDSPVPVDITPASPHALGQILGEFSLIIPSEHQFSKVSGSHIVLPDGPAEWHDFVNVQLMTRGLVWKKHWCIASHTELRKQPLGSIAFMDLSYIRKADPLMMPVPFSIELGLNLPLSPSSSQTVLQQQWKDCFVDAGDEKAKAVTIYIYCDSQKHLT
ncbi:hypothetical protein EDD86DRAFT_250336 [Gorgonomyces haynaldii]|nr:hypothetical protein EDD86DRAFT_250336 [Gorgonomyces haynaldii]